jgi:DNA-binding NarL/FixJ family response regulator
MPTHEVALVSRDLLFASRLRAVLGPVAQLALAVDGEVPEAATVFVDLNDDVDARIDLIAALRARGGTRIIGFCQHDERAVRVRAMEHGADQVVTNGALQQAALRLIGAGSA